MKLKAVRCSRCANIISFSAPEVSFAAIIWELFVEENLRVRSVLCAPK